jgi:hypothetical protein
LDVPVMPSILKSVCSPRRAGTNEDTLINILCRRTLKQRMAIREAFKAHFMRVRAPAVWSCFYMWICVCVCVCV